MVGYYSWKLVCDSLILICRFQQRFFINTIFLNTFIWKSKENNGEPHKPHTDLIIRSLENLGWSR